MESAPDPFKLLKPKRKIKGYSAILLPFLENGNINGRHMSGDKIAKAVRDNLSIAISGESIRRHRRQSCRCEK